MKTNQLMQVRIGEYVQPIEHKTMMGSLNHLWEYGNGLRANKGFGGLSIQDWRNSPQTLELMQALDRKYNQGNTMIIETDVRGRMKVSGMPESRWIKTKRGKGGGTWVHLMLMLDAAAYLDADFKLDIYDTFINHKIIQWRDDSGDEFINLNVAIDAYLSGREGKNNKGVFIQCAVRLKDKLKPDGDNWNTASYLQLERRAEVEKQLVGLLRLGVVRDFEHLKELIEKL